jgi:tRNA-modifying protein YgfZ
MNEQNLPHSLSHLAVIRASGPDAATFLQGQLSQDFLLVAPLTWQLAAYCSPKGRLLASFWGIKLIATPQHQDIALVLSKDILEPTLKRLKMFVLRAKVELLEASELLPELVAQQGLAVWTEREVERGIARITAPLVDLFVPQMLNYESIGGVSFKKGCYPGQEVVARSQFRGAIKRRTYLLQVPSGNLPTVGSDVFVQGQDEAVGTIVQVEGDQVLACLQVAASQAELRLSSSQPLKLLPLPYALKDDI